jgi:hypothetical protein
MSKELVYTINNDSELSKMFECIDKVKKALPGGPVVVTLGRKAKTRAQEEKYHAMIGDIAAQAKHLGATWGAEDWKRLLLDKFARETGRSHGKIIPNLDSDGVVQVGILSRKFGLEDGSEFIEFLHAWAAVHGIEFAGEVTA